MTAGEFRSAFPGKPTGEDLTTPTEPAEEWGGRCTRLYALPDPRPTDWRNQADVEAYVLGQWRFDLRAAGWVIVGGITITWLHDDDQDVAAVSCRVVRADDAGDRCPRCGSLTTVIEHVGTTRRRCPVCH